jgi:hypothetical protein
MKRSKSPSKERALFESIYSITIEVSCQILLSYNLSHVITHELQRVFRSDYFKPVPHDLLKDPVLYISFRFMKSLKSTFEEKESTDSPKETRTVTNQSNHFTPFQMSKLKIRTDSMIGFKQTKSEAGRMVESTIVTRSANGNGRLRSANGNGRLRSTKPSLEQRP